MSATDELLHGDPLYRDAASYADATRIDLTWQDGPTLLLWAADGTRHRYQLNRHEAAALVRRLVGYLFPIGTRE